MKKKLEQEAVTFQGYYELILTYIDTYRPSVKETLEFVGSLTFSVVDMLDLSESEKQLYLSVYNKLFMKKVKEKREKVWMN